MDEEGLWGEMIVVPKDPCPCWNVKLKLLYSQREPKSPAPYIAAAGWLKAQISGSANPHRNFVIASQGEMASFPVETTPFFLEIDVSPF
jgi:hypothetical protein